MAIKKKRTMGSSIKRVAVAIEHTGFYGYLLRYKEAMLMRNYSEETLVRRENDIRRFVGWCEERGLDHPQDITKPILENYQKYLFYYRQANGSPLASASRNRYITGIKQFFKWLTRENYLLYNPASELMLSREAPSLPTVLSLAEVDRLLDSVNLGKASGVRDRAILEVLYSTGIRRTELCNLELSDICFTRLTLFVRKGKNGKDRMLPLGARAAKWVNDYLDDVRPGLLLSLHEQHIFLTDYGEPFTESRLGDKVKRCLHNSGIDVPGSCHLLRHAMATHMLENGADIRYIQAMLGHTDLGTTQIYTHVSIRKLQEVHAETHPAKLESKEDLLARLQLESDEESDN